MQQLLSLFPLHTVLFPGDTLPLHIFEERYKLMIGRCISLREPFGVVLIREGNEVGGGAEPFDVGTTATIKNALRFNNGQMFIAAEGKNRFRIREVLQSEPYSIALVDLLNEELTSEHQVQAAFLREVYERYRQVMAHLAGPETTLADLPDDPQAMSYQLSAQLHIPYLSKQQLLEAELDTRLEALAAAINEELQYLPRNLDGPPPGERGWSLN